MDAVKLDALLCDLYAYVDDHRYNIERDWDEDISDDDRRIAHEENSLKSRIYEYLVELRTASGGDIHYPLK